jgi:hypothetical protein
LGVGLGSLKTQNLKSETQNLILTYMCYFLPGMAVEINKFGQGRIIKIIGKTALVSIKSLKDLQIELSLADMKPLSDASFSRDDIITGPEDRNKFHTGQEKSLVKKTIESLRFGLVPEENIEELTLGFEELSSWVEKGLSKCLHDIPCGFQVSGPYGTGKSHTLSLIRYMARKKGFLTARVELDGQTLSLSNHGTLLNNLWASLSENDIDFQEPLIDLYIKAINNGTISSQIITEDKDKIKNNLTTIHTLIRTGHIDKYAHIAGSIISSGNEYTPSQARGMIKESNINKSDIILEKMIGSRVSGRASDFILSLAGHAALAKLAGYRGLIVTMDEFEIEYTHRKKLIKTEETLKALYDYFKGKTNYFNVPLGIFFAVVDQYGKEGDPLIEKYIAFDKGSRYKLKIFNRTQRVNLAEKIHSIYCEAYSLENTFNRKLASEVENLLAKKIEDNDSGLIRSFIKWYMSLLDVNYGPPKE